MRIVKFILIFSLLMCSSTALCQPTCCLRTVATLPIDNTGLSSAFESPIHHDCARSDCHPYSIMSLEGQEELRRIVDEIGKAYGAAPDPEAQKIVSQMLDLDYVFRGELAALEGAEGPSAYTLKIEFFDHHRGQTVKAGETSWTGIVADGNDAVRALALTFLPLDELMLDYERIPETAVVHPERDPIDAGDTMTVNIGQVVDGKNRSPQPWQFILAKANKGKILNGTPQAEGFHRFQVGDGSIDLRYQAPDECENQTEMIAVYNSCNNDLRTVVNLIPENSIAVATFEIHCEPKNTWTGTVTYTRNFNKVNREPGPDGSIVEHHEIVSENADFVVHGWPFSHSYEGSVGTDLYYEGDEDSLTGSYSGTYKKIVTIESPDGQATITDTAFCQATIRDSGYVVINNEEMRAYLELGLSTVEEEPCRGTTVYSGPSGSFTTEFDWDQLETFAGMGYLESGIPGKDPGTVSGSYSLPGWGITWTWNLTLSGR